MVRGDIDGSVRNRRIRLPILAIYIYGFVSGAVSTGAARANLRELTNLPNIHHNIPSDDTTKPVRDDRDG